MLPAFTSSQAGEAPVSGSQPDKFKEAPSVKKHRWTSLALMVINNSIHAGLARRCNEERSKFSLLTKVFQ